jgi:hypothetical protein
MKIIFAGILLSALAPLATLHAADVTQTLLSAETAAQTGVSVSRPNVLFIAIDDLNPLL